MQVIKLVCKNSKMKLVFCVPAQTADSMPIKRDDLRNGQIHISVNGRRLVICIISTYLLDHQQYLTYRNNISHI